MSFKNEIFIKTHCKIILLKTVIYIKIVLFYLLKILECFFQSDILLNVTKPLYLTYIKKYKDQKNSR